VGKTAGSGGLPPAHPEQPRPSPGGPDLAAEKYRLLVEQIPAITYVAALDEASTTLYVSPQIEEILGLTPADYAADPDLWRKHLHPEDRDRVMTELAEAHAGGAPLCSEYRMVAADGRTVWLRDEARVLRDPAGRPVALQGVMYDVSQRHSAEEQSRELERSLRRRSAELKAINDLSIELAAATSVDHASQIACDRLLEMTGARCTAMALFDLVKREIRTTHLACSEKVRSQARQFLGVGPTELRYQMVPGFPPLTALAKVRVLCGMSEAFFGQLPPDRAQALERALELGEMYGLVLIHSGELQGTMAAFMPAGAGPLDPEVLETLANVVAAGLWHRRAVAVLQHSNVELEARISGHTVALTETNARLEAELAERRRTEGALRESEARFRALFESAPVGIGVFDAQGRVIRVNEAYARMLGYTPAKLAGRNGLDFTHPDERAQTAELMAETTEGRRDHVHVEKHYLRKDGTPFWVNLTVSVVRDADGRLQYRVVVAEDVEERKHAEEEIRKRQEELEHANRELERLQRDREAFVAMVSHELRTPLVTGLGYVEMILEGRLGPVDERGAAGLRVAQRNLRRLSAMVDDILVYHSLIRTGRGTGPVLAPFDPRELLGECRDDFLARTGRDGATVGLDAPAGLPRVSADAEMIRRVISNLLDNAERHGGAGARVRLSASAVAGGDRIRFAVSDDGPGVREDLRERAFEPFVKDPGQRQGAGLGLTIVKGILQAHGAEVELRSEPGEGTRICFELPAAEAAAGGSPEAEAAGTDARPAAPARILVVDDDQDALDYVRLILSGFGHAVRTAPSAEAALEDLRAEPADLALVDMSLPGMDGAELCSRLKAAAGGGRMPVLMFSARAEDSARARAHAAGCDGYLVKPLAAGELLTAIGRALQT
jgi:PAS domain S-box-containing protein